ncbi:MAG: rhodanese-like domain-containing protein [Candidatus Moraniibacteriota bacterium]|jgi:rhodanese-related sulfurtransferase
MNVPSITVEETKEILEKDKDVILLDVRTAGENTMSKIANSILKPLNEIQGDTSDLDKNKKILIYCATGSRSQIACNILQNEGFENCFDVSGGISAWQRAGFEIEKGENINPFAQMFGL